MAPHTDDRPGALPAGDAYASRLLFLCGDGHIPLSPEETRALNTLIFMGISQSELRLDVDAEDTLTIRFGGDDRITLRGDWRGARIWLEFWGDPEGNLCRLEDLAVRRGIPAKAAKAAKAAGAVAREAARRPEAR